MRYNKMKNISDFAIKDLKSNKKMTVSIILAIIISVVLINSVITLALSYQEYMINISRSKENWEARFSNIPYSVAKEIAEDENIKETSFYQRLGISEEDFCRKDINREVKFDVRAYDENALKNANVHITEGRLPENSNEILLSLSIRKNNILKQKINIGDKFKVTLNRKNA